MPFPDTLTDEQLFAFALLTGCAMTSSVRSEDDGKVMLTLTTVHPVGYYRTPSGGLVVVEQMTERRW